MIYLDSEKYLFAGTLVSYFKYIFVLLILSFEKVFNSHTVESCCLKNELSQIWSYLEYCAVSKISPRSLQQTLLYWIICYAERYCLSTDGISVVILNFSENLAHRNHVFYLIFEYCCSSNVIFKIAILNVMLTV